MNTDENMGRALASLSVAMNDASASGCLHPQAYRMDYIMDQLWIVEHKPRAFIWIVRSMGTHIYALEYYTRGKGCIPPLDELKQLKAAIGRHRSRGDVKRAYVFYDGCRVESDLVRIEQLIDSYILQRKVYDTPTPPEETGGLPI